MTPEEIQNTIDRISWGARYCKVKDAAGREIFVILKSLSLADKNWVNFIFNQALEEGQREGLFRESDLFMHYRKIGVWSEKKEKKIIGLKEDIEKLRSETYKEELSSRDKRIKQAFLSGAEKALRKLLNEKEEKFSTSLERYAHQQKLRATIYCSVYSLDNTKFWKSWDDFLNEYDSELINNLIFSYLDYKPLTQSEIRKIARSAVWRFKWSGSKNCDNLFGKPIVELDAEQEALVYWSQVYDSVYEAYERPSDETINNDEKLDKWFEEQSRKRKVEAISRGKSVENLGVSKKVGKHSEVFIVANRDVNPDAPEMGEIWDLNSEGNRRFINIEKEKIKRSGGLVNERQLRPDKKTRMLAGAQRAEFEVRQGKKKVTKLQDY